MSISRAKGVIGCENATRLAGNLFQCPVHQVTSISLPFNRTAESLPNYLSYEWNTHLWSWRGKHGTLCVARHCLPTVSQPAIIGWIKNSSLSICVRNETKTSRSVARLEIVVIASSVRRSALRQENQPCLTEFRKYAREWMIRLNSGSVTFSTFLSYTNNGQRSIVFKIICYDFVGHKTDFTSVLWKGTRKLNCAFRWPYDHIQLQGTDLHWQVNLNFLQLFTVGL